MSGPSSYKAFVTANNGATIEMVARGSDAGAALTNLRRSLVGDWCRIEVGLGEGNNFKTLQEIAR